MHHKLSIFGKCIKTNIFYGKSPRQSNFWGALLRKITRSFLDVPLLYQSFRTWTFFWSCYIFYVTNLELPKRLSPSSYFNRSFENNFFVKYSRLNYITYLITLTSFFRQTFYIHMKKKNNNKIRQFSKVRLSVYLNIKLNQLESMESISSYAKKGVYLFIIFSFW